MKKDLLLVLKGFIIGSSMSVPGVSGGTMAILLGIYDRMIQAVSHFFKDIKGNTLYLGKICVGGVLGLFSLAFVIKALLEKFPIPVSIFFLGAVIGGIPALYKKTKEQKINTVQCVKAFRNKSVFISSFLYIYIHKSLCYNQVQKYRTAWQCGTSQDFSH